MKVVRKLTMPGNGRQYESAQWEFELTTDEMEQMYPGFKSLPLQQQMHFMSLNLEARVLANHVADGLISNDEMSTRLVGFVELPDWLAALDKLKKNAV